MLDDSLIKKHKIKRIYAYHEEKQEKNKIAFGWVPSKPERLEGTIVISSESKAKSVKDSDREWSKSEGNNAASAKDYSRYFKSLTGDTPEDFIERWNDSLPDLEESRKRQSSKYREGEGDFLFSLARLLVDGKKFTKFGRNYKIIDSSS